MISLLKAGLCNLEYQYMLTYKFRMMKKLLFLPLVALFAMFVSCSSDDSDGDRNVKPVVSDKSYRGTLDSDGFSKEIVVDVTMYEATSTMDIVLNDVKFAAGMPLTLKITLRNIPYFESDGKIEFRAMNVDPYMNTETEPASAYRFALVEGSISNGEMHLSARMAEGLAQYVAGKEFEFEGKEISGGEIKPAVVDKNYGGTLVSNGFSTEIVIDVIMHSAASTADIVLNGVKFADKMPAITITLKNISYSKSEGNTKFYAENISPYINTDPKPSSDYKFAVAEGTVSGGKLLFSARMADGLAPYLAGMEFSFEGEEIVE